MSQQESCCNGEWAKYGLLAVLIAGGAAGGLYFSGGWPGTSAAPATIPETAAVPANPLKTQRFPLTSFDIKDQVEAPELAADASGRVYLVWASQVSDTEKTLCLSRSDASGSFSEPSTVARTGIVKFPAQMSGKTITRDSRIVPHVAVGAGAVHLAWAETLPDRSGIRMVYAVSADAGTTFGPAQTVHQALNARPTFTSLAIGADGTIACSWLDNREKFQQPFTAVREAGQAKFDEERLVHAAKGGRGICPCCPMAQAIAPDGTVYVAFRNIADGYRDIAIGRKAPGQSTFDGPFPVVPPTWKFNGCPHDGASMAIAGDTLHIVWMDARSGSQRCYYAKAKLADMKFEASELNPIAAGSQGNAKLFADSEGVLHVVWEESLGAEPDGGKHRHGPPQVGQGGGRAIMYAQKHGCCPQFGKARAIAAKSGVFQTRPSIAGTNGELVVAWNELDETGKAVVVTRLSEGNQP